MKTDLYEYTHYKAYLRDWIHALPKRGHGVRSKIAEALRCQVAFVSQVINSELHFSLEQAEALNRFIGHTRDESHFFLLLLQRERAGTPALIRYFEEQIQAVLQKRLNLKERLDVKKTLSLENQATYYSAWYYAAIHVALSVKELRTKEALSKRFQLPISRVVQVLEFLVSVGLAIPNESEFSIGTTRIHLANDSPLVSRHHANWRVKAIESMEKGEENDLHYSSSVTMSEPDVLKLKGMLVKWITESKEFVRQSKEEDVHCLSLDFFRVKG